MSHIYVHGSYEWQPNCGSVQPGPDASTSSVPDLKERRSPTASEYPVKLGEYPLFSFSQTHYTAWLNPDSPRDTMWRLTEHEHRYAV